MGDYQAPQWIDFIESCSPQPPISDFFETVHAVHERVPHEPMAENTKNVQLTESQTSDVPCVDVKAQEDLNIIKSTPVKVISPKHRNNKETVAAGETTYEQVLSDAMKRLELCKKPHRGRAHRSILNKTLQQSEVFKTPNVPFTKSSRSVGYRSMSDKRIQHTTQNSIPRAVKGNARNATSIKNNATPIKNNATAANMKRTPVSYSLCKENQDHGKNDRSKRPNNAVPGPENNEEGGKEDAVENEARSNEEHEKRDNKPCQEKDNDGCAKEDEQESNETKDIEVTQDASDGQMNDDENDKGEYDQDTMDATRIKKHNQTQVNKRTAAVLTWQNRRRSLHKRRSVPGNNHHHYVSLAEAASRFQTETPKRFRTRSAKENQAASTTFNMSKLLQNRLKPTIPISPALVSKNRTRAVTALSQEEREKLEMEQIKKNPIKANPIPLNVLRGPRMKNTAATKKQATMDSASTTSAKQLNREKDRAVNAASTLRSKSTSSLQHNKVMSIAAPRNTVTKVLVTDPTGIIVEREEITFFGVPKDTGITKSATRIVPFSFEARNKNLQMKREERLKSLQEASNAKPESFHARPAPNFTKSSAAPASKQQQATKKLIRAVLPCPFSFEDRDKKLWKRKEELVKQVLEEDKRGRVFRANPVPVFKPVMVRGRSKEHISIKDKSVKMTGEQTDKECEENQENKEPNVDSSKAKSSKYTRKAINNASCIANNTPLMEKHEENVKALPIELNTDKRAKERREFDEKIKRKEVETATKRQEENRELVEREKQIKVELRKLTEVKARPMPVYKSLVIDKATKQLTNPQSPAFASKLRMK